MNRMDKPIFVDKIAKLIEEDKSGMGRFLQATPFTRLPFYTLGGLVTSKEFIEYLYMESARAKEHKEKLYSFLNNVSGKNTLYILGYQGCGKTTFINTLIQYFIAKKEYREPKIINIDCDKYGASSEKKPLEAIFTQRFMDYIQLDSEKKICDFIDFYENNFHTLTSFANIKRLNIFKEFVLNTVVNGKALSDNEEIMRLNELISTNLQLKDILYLFILIALSSEYNSSTRILDPILLVIDNLDYVDDFNELRFFINAIDDLTVDMSIAFDSFKVYRNSDVKYCYLEKIKVLIAMRETTKANLPKEHWSDANKAIYEYYDVTEWYDKSEIIQHRLTLLDSSLCLSEKKQREKRILANISRDPYIKNILIPLYNNNYRSSISAITRIISENEGVLSEYSEISTLQNTKMKYGARGVLLKYIFDEFCTDIDGTESCFRKIGVLDLLNRKNNDVSIPRLILTYLSNYTDTRCDDARNCVSLQEIINSFSGIIRKQEIIKSILNMYELQSSIWTHLVSFSQLDRQSTVNGSSVIDNINFDQSKLHYSCAGKIYLEHVTSHFEFFSSRIYKSNYKALFCKENREPSEAYDFLFIEIITGVFSEVKKCCASLKKFNEKVCRLMNYPNPYQTGQNTYLESHYVCQLKRIDGRRSKQYHEDRLINAHIRYIDLFRIYILNYTNIHENKKQSINISLLTLLGEYVDLLKTVLISRYTNTTLVPYYSEQLKKALNNSNDFSIEINTPDDN